MNKLIRERLNNIEKLFNDGYGERGIAKLLNITRGKVNGCLIKLGLRGFGRRDKSKLYKEIKKERKCTSCLKIKKRKSENREYISGKCIICEKLYFKIYNSGPIPIIKGKEYRKNNKEKLNAFIKLKKIRDPAYKLRTITSACIYKYLKNNNGSKNKKSISKFLPYTMKELKTHLENQFEPWMSWANWGVYKKNEWKDEDSSTWKWQIDHIIPHSTFKYISMKDKEFRDCWTLENLRPYSAKQNAIDGGNQTRHIKNSS